MNQTNEVLKVTADGKFEWNEDADRMIEEGDFSGQPAMQHILRALRNNRAAVLAEREACAKEAEVLAAKEYNGGQQRMPVYYSLKDCAAAIRARSSK